MEKLPRRQFIRSLAAAGAAASLNRVRVFAANPSQSANKGIGSGTEAIEIRPDDIIPAPSDPAQWAAFRDALVKWRKAAKTGLAYSDALYRRQDFAWVPSCYCCCFVMMCDEAFYNPKRGRYSIDSFIKHGIEQFGGYDAIVLWHAYPRIGVDDRNQFDFYRDMPGGLTGLRTLTDACHAQSVRVFIDYNPWDTGTRRENKPDLDVLAELIEATNADGIFLDTMNRGAAEFRAKLDSVRPGVVLEGEGALPLENVYNHHMSWAQWFKDSHVPGVLRNKWFERRHMQHQIRRWDREHTAELHTAWMNGSGMMVWENVFGTWVGWSRRDRSILRAMLPIQRRYARLFCGEGWTPLVPTLAPDLYANLWEGDGLRLWTMVNRSDKDIEGPLLRTAYIENAGLFDLISGREVGNAAQNDSVMLSGRIRPRGIGAFVCGTEAALGKDFPQFLAGRHKLDSRVEFDVAFPGRSAVLKPVTPTKKYAGAEVPPGMVEVPPAEFDMKVEFRTRECGFYNSQTDAALTFPKLHTSATFERKVSLARYAIDLTPVTNAQFARFLKATGYKPRHPDNFLKHWSDGSFPPGREDHPVVYVDLDDARAYAKWVNKRLPTEGEWQHAAQGPEGLKYPWGNEMLPGRCNDGQTGGTTPVTAFPDGRSPFGCYDMCGNTWEWTESERSDGRTRFCIIRGGSYYQAKGSDWYTDGGPRPCSFAVKLLLMWPGLDRCATIGFRCVADLADR